MAGNVLNTWKIKIAWVVCRVRRRVMVPRCYEIGWVVCRVRTVSYTHLDVYKRQVQKQVEISCRWNDQ